MLSELLPLFVLTVSCRLLFLAPTWLLGLIVFSVLPLIVDLVFGLRAEHVDQHQVACT